ncbi:polyprenyl synthetase family protein [soil metagenome]
MGGIVERLTTTFERALAEVELPQEPKELYDPVRYILSGKGKRVRPTILLLTAEALQEGASDVAMPAALGVEVFHTFTLVHDDVMDQADERRGRPTVHVKWDVNTAILAGDLVHGLSNHLVAQTRTPRLGAVLSYFHEAVVRVCEGQALDAAFERRGDVTVDEYLTMIQGKTGALLEACLLMGGAIGGATEQQLAMLRDAGRALGRAFQIQDDLLDLVATDEHWGKPVGGDLIVGKKTLLLLLALERASGADAAFFERIVERPGLEHDLVSEARHRMERLGVLADVQLRFEQEYSTGLAALSGLPSNDSASALYLTAERLGNRQS